MIAKTARQAIEWGSIETEQVPIGSLREHPRNPRIGDVDEIARSLTKHGQYRAIVVADDGVILAGNHTWKGAQRIGWSTVAAHRLPIASDSPQALEILLADNKASDGSSYEDETLAELLVAVKESQGDLEATLWTDEELSRLLDSLKSEAQGESEDPDEAPEAPEDPISSEGDVWLLGPHRLLVGDATLIGSYEKLLGSERVQMVLTDPPYGVSYQDRNGGEHLRRDALRVSNDDLGERQAEEFLRDALSLVHSYTVPGCAWYVFGPPGPAGNPFGTVLGELEVYRQRLAWVKDSLVFGRSDYQFRHEDIYYGWTKGDSRHPVENRTETSVWEFPRPRKSSLHPTMKPTELIERALRNSSDRDWLVLDPFAGSGTTLVAAQRTGRVARVMELDPAYADVICRRWQQTFHEPVRSDSRGTVDFLKRIS